MHRHIWTTPKRTRKKCRDPLHAWYEQAPRLRTAGRGYDGAPQGARRRPSSCPCPLGNCRDLYRGSAEVRHARKETTAMWGAPRADRVAPGMRVRAARRPKAGVATWDDSRDRAALQRLRRVPGEALWRMGMRSCDSTGNLGGDISTYRGWHGRRLFVVRRRGPICRASFVASHPVDPTAPEDFSLLYVCSRNLRYMSCTRHFRLTCHLSPRPLPGRRVVAFTVLRWEL
ncbi:hypothetical protein P171DRAFT_114512 [Karstenula rhodostoma CBS 690.94]|uniref:Uncharacterized protein n=1 Tax=Karstenula rhodostoma CBS 690.94 TaxID=1392251 RepID=A0A9P4U7J7_9PLEO|nr:hypothetical protein P171DRAFT_114512 [Karstenula rhodostoma CBS 690.94]